MLNSMISYLLSNSISKLAISVNFNTLLGFAFLIAASGIAGASASEGS